MLRKLKNKINNIAKLFFNFGFIISFDNFLTAIVFRKDSSIRRKCIKREHKNIQMYLLKKYKYLIDKYQKNQENDNNITEDCPIWIFWWQGYQHSPEIVKKCINSIKNHSGNHEVKILSEENLKDFLDLPEYIYEKLNTKKISYAAFSDIIRVSLLYEYGGIWIDSTTFLTREFDNKFYNYNFYTVKHNLFSDFHVCRGKWALHFLVSSKGNQFMKYLKDFLLEYWKKEKWIIHYFLLDDIIAIGYDYLNFVKDEIDNVPINNTDIYKLCNIINEPYNQQIFDQINLNTYIHKLTYKMNFVEKKDNKYTFYHEIMKNDK